VGASVPADPNAGAAGTVYNTSKALRELGCEVDEFWAGDMPHRIKHGNLHYLLELPCAYRRAVRERCAQKEYDVVQLSQPHAYLAAEEHQRLGRPGVFVNRSHGLELRVNQVVRHWRKQLGVKANRFPRSLFSPVLGKMLERHWLKVASASDGIIFGCHEDRDFLVRALDVGPQKVVAIPHGVSEVYLRHDARPMTPRRRRRLLFVGQYAFFKAPHILAGIVDRVLSLHAGATFTWVCAARHQKAAAALLDGGIRDRVCFMDWLSQQELVSVYDDHGIFLFPSFFEGFGKAPLEAMARGLCVVASETGGMRDYVRSGKNGFLAPVGDVDGFVTRTRELLGRPDLCRSMSRQARSTALNYGWRRCAQEAVAFYRRLLEAKASESRS